MTAQVHCHRHQLQDALAAVEAAWKYAELSDSPYVQAFVSQVYTGILLSADRAPEGLARFRVSLTMLQEALKQGVEVLNDPFMALPLFCCFYFLSYFFVHCD